MQEEQLSFLELAKREQYVTQIPWSIGQKQGTTIYSVQIPYGVLSSRTIAAAFERFKYFRGDCHMRFLLQSNPFQCGQLIVDYAPLVDSDQTTIEIPTRSIRNNVLLRAGSTKSATLIIPYAHLKNFLAKDNDMPIATVSVTVMNELLSGPTSTNRAYVSVFASFPNAQFSVIDPGASNLVTNSSQGGVASKVTNINIDHVANSSLDMSGMTDEMESKQDGQISGCDRPNIGLSYQPARLMKYPDLANGSNIDYCNRMALDSGGCTSLATAHISNTENEMDLRYLATKWCFSYTARIQADHTAGHIITSGPMTPVPLAFQSVYNSTFGTTPTLLEYISLPFAMWRGSLEYKFEFVPSSMHAARLAFATHYGTDTHSEDVFEAFGQYAEVFDMTGENTEFVVNVPFRTTTDWLYLTHGGGTTPNENVTTMGLWSLRIVNALMTMPSVSAFVDVNVYVRAGPDFELKFLDVGTADYFIENASQGDVLGDDAADSAENDGNVVVEVAPTNSTRTLGGNWYNLRNTFKRSFPVDGLLGTSSPHDNHDLMFSNRRSIVAWYSSMYRIWYGDVRLRAFTNTGCHMTTSNCADLDIILDMAGLRTDCPTGPRCLTDAQVGVLDTQIPWISPYNFALIAHPGETLRCEQYYGPTKFQLELEATTGNPERLKEDMVFVAAGENFRTAMLYNIPKIIVTEKWFQHTPAKTLHIPTTVTFWLGVIAATEEKPWDKLTTQNNFWDVNTTGTLITNDISPGIHGLEFQGTALTNQQIEIFLGHSVDASTVVIADQAAQEFHIPAAADIKCISTPYVYSDAIEVATATSFVSGMKFHAVGQVYPDDVHPQVQIATSWEWRVDDNEPTATNAFFKTDALVVYKDTALAPVDDSGQQLYRWPGRNNYDGGYTVNGQATTAKAIAWDSDVGIYAPGTLAVFENPPSLLRARMAKIAKTRRSPLLDTRPRLSAPHTESPISAARKTAESLLADTRSL